MALRPRITINSSNIFRLWNFSENIWRAKIWRQSMEHDVFVCFVCNCGQSVYSDPWLRTASWPPLICTPRFDSSTMSYPMMVKKKKKNCYFKTFVSWKKRFAKKRRKKKIRRKEKNRNFSADKTLRKSVNLINIKCFLFCFFFFHCGKKSSIFIYFFFLTVVLLFLFIEKKKNTSNSRKKKLKKDFLFWQMLIFLINLVFFFF